MIITNPPPPSNSSFQNHIGKSPSRSFRAGFLILFTIGPLPILLQYNEKSKYHFCSHWIFSKAICFTANRVTIQYLCTYLHVGLFRSFRVYLPLLRTNRRHLSLIYIYTYRNRLDGHVWAISQRWDYRGILIHNDPMENPRIHGGVGLSH
jgi:hypothetical protein